ncbi:unnamed protein product, partial [Mesorhabditis spiculigera]
MLGAAPVFGNQECVLVTGKVGCLNDAGAAAGVKVELWDSDALWEADVFINRFGFKDDDLMRETLTNEDGKFKLYGCASDTDVLPGLFGKNKPDPYLKIHHNCSGPGQVKRMDLLQQFLGDKQEVRRTLYLNPAHKMPLAVVVCIRDPNNQDGCPGSIAVTSPGSILLVRPMVRICLLFLRIFGLAWASYECVDLYGRVSCGHDEARAANVEVQLWDSDGFLGIQRFNEDDLMGSTRTNAAGNFSVYGCAMDPNFLFIPDRPDPYLKIKHNCNGVAGGETLTVPLNQTFEPVKVYLDIRLSSPQMLEAYAQKKQEQGPSGVDLSVFHDGGLIPGMDPEQIRAGDTAVITCRSSSGANLEWTKNDAPLKQGSRSDRIRLENITAADDGNYKCHQHTAGRLTLVGAKTLTVNAREPIEPFSHTSSHMTDQIVNLRCPIPGAANKQIVWTKDGGPIGQHLGHTGNQSHLLFLTPFTQEHEGNYTCELAGVPAIFRLLFIKPPPIELHWIIVAFTTFSVCLFVIFLLVAKCRKHQKRAKNLTVELYEMQQALLNKGFSWDQLRKEMLPMDQQVEKLAYEASLFEIPPRHLRIGDTIDSGHFGLVKKGWLKPRISGGGGEEVLVAVKMALNLEDTKQQKMLTEELKIMGAIRPHRNILRLLGAVTKDMRTGRLYIVTEFCERGSLLHYVQGLGKESRISIESPRYPSPTTVFESIFNSSSTESGPPVPKIIADAASAEMESLLTVQDLDVISELLDFAIQIAQGMAFLSEVPCVHRDLAARNVLLTRDKTCRIADFGLAKRMMNDYYRKAPDSDERMPTRWLSPEALGTMRYTQASDVWSFGILLYEMFTLGDKPYPGVGNEVLPGKIKDGLRCPRPKYATDAFYAFMNDCWALSPAKRPNFKAIRMFQLSNQQLELEEPKPKVEIFEVQNSIYFGSANTHDNYEPVTRRLQKNIDGLN